MEISNKFAYLPNGIIREIISYTGATYKKRNGKYMGQIPKNDIRYVLLLTIPKKTFIHSYYMTPTLVYFSSWVTLMHTNGYGINGINENDESDRYDLYPSLYLDVYGFKYINDPCFGNKEVIEYKLIISDWKGNIRTEKFDYYYQDKKNYDRFNDNLADIKKKCDIIQAKINNLQKLCIIYSMFTFGLIIHYIRNSS